MIQKGFKFVLRKIYRKSFTLWEKLGFHILPIRYIHIRYFKPRRIIEVGAGFSTLLAAEAISKNEEEGLLLQTHRG